MFTLPKGKIDQWLATTGRIIAAERSRHTHSNIHNMLVLFPWIVWVVLVLVKVFNISNTFAVGCFWKISLSHTHSHNHTDHFKPFTTAELLYQRQTFRVDLWHRPAAGPGTPEWWRPRLVIWGLLNQPCRCAPTLDSRRCTRSVKIYT